MAETQITRPPTAENKAERPDSAPEAAADSETNIIKAGERFLAQEKVERQVLEMKMEAANSDVEQTQSAVERFAADPAIAQKIQALLEGKKQQASEVGNRMQEKQAKREMESMSAFLQHHETFKDVNVEDQQKQILADLKSKKENPQYAQDPNVMAEVRALEGQLDDIDDYVSGKATVERKMQMHEDDLTPPSREADPTHAPAAPHTVTAPPARRTAPPPPAAQTA